MTLSVARYLETRLSHFPVAYTDTAEALRDPRLAKQTLKSK